ncbi:FAD-binding protein [Shewanella gelidii]|uniref:Fumarate reductase flavoprotein subunit n=1 Tax=Shewanella gelidii TaxID=1642821 RepID=A0A917JLK6_9GAMM|nr:FAD-binding protein [Shewanella gelidii]MCL1096915.1 FAD-binding protein [Shewanella gelidii]GGI71180.1 fumarate reductase flavoprotein subunit [Shewanella gelidii]
MKKLKTALYVAAALAALSTSSAVVGSESLTGLQGERAQSYGSQWQHHEPAIVALEQDLKVRENALSKAPQSKTNIVVIGSGSAGFSAAVSARDAGAQVIMIDKKHVVEANDAVEAKLVEALADQSSNSAHWLASLGADLNQHMDDAGVCAHVMKVLHQNALERGVDLRMDTRGVEVLKDEDGRVRGVLVNEKNRGYYWIETDAVVLADEAKDGDALAKLDPKLKHLIATSHPEVHPTLSVQGGVMVTEAIRGSGAILVNREGKRFVNELATRDKAAAAILEQSGGSVFLVFDDSVRRSLKKIDNYIDLGVVSTESSLQALGASLGIDGKALQQSVALYNRHVGKGIDLEFDRLEDRRPDMTKTLKGKHFYAIEVSPGVHHTVGGVSIDAKAEILNAKTETIPGLYGASELAASLQNDQRPEGSLTADVVTFGKLAGEHAAAYSRL